MCLFRKKTGCKKGFSFSVEEEIELSQNKDAAPRLDSINVSVIKLLSSDDQAVLLKDLSKLCESKQYLEVWRKEIKLHS